MFAARAFSRQLSAFSQTGLADGSPLTAERLLPIRDQTSETVYVAGLEPGRPCFTIWMMSPYKLASAADSALVVIDIQERLAAVMPSRDAVVRATGILIEAATRLNVPVLLSEQYPKGLGATVAEVARKLPESATRVEKTCFSASPALAVTRRQVVLAGMEAHVCVLQTAMEFAAAGLDVFVVADAVCSRSEANYRNALARMQSAGIIVTNSESVIFEWLRDAAHEHFRALSALIR